jgi:Zeta toxin
VTGRVWASKEELETACSLYEFTWWETSPTVQAMRADAGAHPGLLGRITAARNAGLVRTRDVYVDDAGHYIPQRTALHEAIVSRCVPRRTTHGHPDWIPEAFFTIGCPGAGKTSTLRALVRAYRDMSHGRAGMPLAIVDADQVRMDLPEYVSGLGSAVVDPECYDVTYGRVFPAALSSGSDLVYDTLGRIDSIRPNIERLIDAGYGVHVLRAEAPSGVCCARALDRALTRDGRLVSERLVKETAEAASETMRVLRRDKVPLAGWAEIDTAHPSGVLVALAADPVWAAALPTLLAANG